LSIYQPEDGHKSWNM